MLSSDDVVTTITAVLPAVNMSDRVFKVHLSAGQCPGTKDA